MKNSPFISQSASVRLCVSHSLLVPMIQLVASHARLWSATVTALPRLDGDATATSAALCVLMLMLMQQLQLNPLLA